MQCSAVQCSAVFECDVIKQSVLDFLKIENPAAITTTAAAMCGA